MSRHFLRPVAFGAILLLLLTVTALPGGAASRPYPAVNLVASAQHTITPNIALGRGCCHDGYAYAEDGDCPDAIDIFKISSFTDAGTIYGFTHVGTSSTNACNKNGLLPGANRLAVAKVGNTYCLLLVDTHNSVPPGFIDSFTINYHYGSLSKEVSHLQVAGGGTPSDVQVAGGTAYIDSPGTDFESYSIGAGCVLTFRSSAPQTNGAYSPQSSLVGNAELIAPDYNTYQNTNTIDVYTLGSGGSINFLKSTSAQFTCPWGVAVGPGPMVFTGQCTTGAPQVEGGTLNTQTGAITFLSGSPASDLSGRDGAAVWYDSVDGLLIQGEQNSFSLGVYKVSNGSMSFMENTQLQVTYDQPVAFAQYTYAQKQQILFMIGPGVPHDNIEACVLSKSKGVTGCAVVATLNNYHYNAGGLALLPR